ncbi:hypothetical protein C5S36_03110 [Candidatus Methanophagaceae archaeon]|nr:hypothetical protein C5S36_03110 [Methanophagales archaeon]
MDEHSTDERCVEKAKKLPVVVVYADHGADDVARQVLHACGNIVGFTDVRMLVASLRNKWLENLVKDFDNDVGAKGGMIR